MVSAVPDEARYSYNVIEGVAGLIPQPVFSGTFEQCLLELQRIRFVDDGRTAVGWRLEPDCYGGLYVRLRNEIISRTAADIPTRINAHISLWSVLMARDVVRRAIFSDAAIWDSQRTGGAPT